MITPGGAKHLPAKYECGKTQASRTPSTRKVARVSEYLFEEKIALSPFNHHP